MTGTVMLGKLLGGRYRIVKLIGEGGFGAVYKANDERFQATRVVAIKEMSDANLLPAFPGSVLFVGERSKFATRSSIWKYAGNLSPFPRRELYG